MIAGAEDLIERPPGIRSFGHDRRPGFADCAPSGRMRLDSIACWLQDVAYADVEDAGLHDVAVWVVRRTRIRVNRFPRFGERFSVTTFCSGIGRMWAERRTDICSDAHPGSVPDVQAVSLWVHLDPEHWRPSPLTETELSTYTGAQRPRHVTARLRHPGPDGGDDHGVWTFRATECDIADHVNNAAYWTPLEDELVRREDPNSLDVEIEYRAPAQPGPKRLLGDGPMRWILGDEEELHASMLLRDSDSDSSGSA